MLETVWAVDMSPMGPNGRWRRFAGKLTPMPKSHKKAAQNAAKPIDAQSLRVWAYTAKGSDGLAYGVRLLLTQAEVVGLQAVGLLPDLAEVITMQDHADQLTVQYERDAWLACGGLLQ